MTGEEQFWRGLFTLLALAAFIIATIPPLAVRLGQVLVAHGQAMSAAYTAYSEAYRSGMERQAEQAK